MFVLSLVGLSLRVPEDSEPFIKPTRRKGGGVKGGFHRQEVRGFVAAGRRSHSSVSAQILIYTCWQSAVV